MAKLPNYLKVEWSYQPTEIDKTGCDGIYIKSSKIKWWGWFVILYKWIKNQLLIIN